MNRRQIADPSPRACNGPIAAARRTERAEFACRLYERGVPVELISVQLRRMWGGWGTSTRAVHRYVTEAGLRRLPARPQCLRFTEPAVREARGLRRLTDVHGYDGYTARLLYGRRASDGQNVSRAG